MSFRLVVLLVASAFAALIACTDHTLHAPDLCAIDDRIQRDVRALVTVADCGD